MKTRRKITSVLMVAWAVLPSLASPASAATKRDHLGDFRDWSTFRDVEDNGAMVCYMISMPKETRLSERGVKRDKPYFMVSHWPRRSERGVVSVSAGYDLRRNADVVITVGEKSFELYGDKATAWTYGLEDDAALVAAMKSGISLSVKAVAARGFSSTDTYSLHGFTAAYNAISAACRK
ncbi:MAG: invasion associated locus B family protein [Pseudomonadota bacterium]